MLGGERLCAGEVAPKAPLQFGGVDAPVTGEHGGQRLEVLTCPGGFLPVLLLEGFEGEI